MKKKPLVSIIIPTCKRYDMIEKAINSALIQTYKNIEIIVIDDNKINSKEHLETQKIVSKYSNVKYYKNEKNLGGALSRNKGIELAKGDFIAFLDDDDFYEPTKIEKQYNLYRKLNNKNVAMIYCYVRNYNGDYEEIGLNKKDFEGKPFYEHMKYFIATTSCWFCPKDILEKLGGFDNVKCQQDSTLILKMLENNYEIYRVPEILLNFVIHDGERITKDTYEYIENLTIYHDKCRSNYKRLTKKEALDVEYFFISHIYNIYYRMNDKQNVYKQLKKLWKLNILNVFTISKTIKYIMMR